MDEDELMEDEMDEYEIYRELDRMLPAHVYRESGEADVAAGEPDLGIEALLDAASMAGCLTDEIIQFIREQFDDDSPVIEVLDALLVYEERERAQNANP